MEKEFVPYELAFRLKKLGFDEPCFGYYVDGELRGINLGIEELGGVEPYYQRLGFHTLSNHDIFNTNKIVVTAPTFSQAFRWFREKYGYLVGPFQNELDNLFFFEIGKLNSLTTEYYTPDCNTYEEAELACLDKLIEIVEQKQKEDGK